MQFLTDMNCNKMSPSILKFASLRKEENSLVVVHADFSVKGKYPGIQEPCKLK